jgi:hypothetical protein
MKKIKVDWYHNRKGDFVGTIAGHGVSTFFVAEDIGCKEPKVTFAAPIADSIRASFEARIGEVIENFYLEIAEMEEEEWREREAANAAHKKLLAQHLDFPTITAEMRQYVVDKCQKDGYDVTMENFEDAIVSNSPRGAFARSYLAQIDDRPGIYDMRRNCCDADTVSLVSAISEEPETTVA